MVLLGEKMKENEYVCITKRSLNKLLFNIECSLIDMCEDNEVMKKEIVEYFRTLDDELGLEGGNK